MFSVQISVFSGLKTDNRKLKTVAYLAKVGKNENFRDQEYAAYGLRRAASWTGAHSTYEGVLF